MSCQEWMEPIALWVDGEPAATGLAEPLEDCGGCSRFLQELRADQAALRSAPEVDVAACAAVRDEALRRVARLRRMGPGWWAAAVAAGLVFAYGWTGARERRPEPTVIQQQAEARRPAVASPPQVTAAKSRRPRVRTRPVSIPVRNEVSMPELWAQMFPEESETEKKQAPWGSTSEVAMQIQTSNPDVVILWLKEERFQ